VRHRFGQSADRSAHSKERREKELKMSHNEDSATCERRDDLISVLYGEATELETAQFNQHLQLCAACEAEMRGFGYVRESIGAWKFEALSGAQPAVNIPTPARRSKSAAAALREFFDLSPLWLKGATAFATLLLCLFAVLAFFRSKEQQPVIVDKNPGAIYTEQEKNQIVEKALAQQRAELMAKAAASPEIKVVKDDAPHEKNVSRSTQVAKGRQPLTKRERQQLAADLRLLARDDDDSLELLSDPIN
jgi:hypothetical protein